MGVPSRSKRCLTRLRSPSIAPRWLVLADAFVGADWFFNYCDFDHQAFHKTERVSQEFYGFIGSEYDIRKYYLREEGRDRLCDGQSSESSQCAEHGNDGGAAPGVPLDQG